MSVQLLRKYIDIINEQAIAPQPGESEPAAPVTVNRQAGTLEYQGREYTIARITPNGPQPRIPPGGVRTKVACADMGFRCLGAFDAVLFGDTAYVYIR